MRTVEEMADLQTLFGGKITDIQFGRYQINFDIKLNGLNYRLEIEPAIMEMLLWRIGLVAEDGTIDWTIADPPEQIDIEAQDKRKAIELVWNLWGLPNPAGDTES